MQDRAISRHASAPERRGLRGQPSLAGTGRGVKNPGSGGKGGFSPRTCFSGTWSQKGRENQPPARLRLRRAPLSAAPQHAAVAARENLGVCDFTSDTPHT
eukprot:6396006-Lingulodinium_polyedra.AAC.1